MDRYRIIEPLGSGGMGEVFLAEDETLHRKVALKFVTPAGDAREASERAEARLRREALAAAALDHPFICKIFDVGTLDGRLFIAMEHVTGETLAERLAKGPLGWREAARLALEIAEALEKAHAARIIHRDLKPSNILVTEHAHVKVMDFGLAHILEVDEAEPDDVTRSRNADADAGSLAGTPAYLSPEQIRGARATEAADAFGLGIVLYEMLTSAHPFRQASVQETMAAILTKEPLPLESADAPNALRTVIDRLLDKDPDTRMVAMEAIRGALLETLDRPDDTLDPPPPPEREAPFVGRDGELARLVETLARTERGRGCLVLIGGEPGVGKTRLSVELLAEARRRGAVCFTGRCYETKGAATYSPIVEIFEQMMRELPPERLRALLADAASEVAKLVPALRKRFPDLTPPAELPPSQARRYLLSNVLEVLERAGRDRLVVLHIDDLHWGDEGTLMLLEQARPALESLRVLIVATYREVELTATRPFAQALEGWIRNREAERIKLDRLSKGDVADLVGRLIGTKAPAPAKLAELIFSETDGNPFFTEEVVRYLSEAGRLVAEDGAPREDVSIETWEVPESVRLVLSRRLEKLDGRTVELLKTAAVAGRDFSVDLLVSASDAAFNDVADALEEAERAHLVRGHVEGRTASYAFEHELTRQTLIAETSLPRRQRVHLRIAEALEQTPEARPSEVAHHLYEAGTAADVRKLARFLALAARAALTSGAAEETLRHAERGLELEGLDDETRAPLLYLRGAAHWGQGAWDQCMSDWQDALARYETLGNPQGVIEVCRGMHVILAWAGKFGDVVVLMERASLTIGRAPTEARCRLLCYWGQALCATERVDEAFAKLHEAESIAETLGDPLVGESACYRNSALHLLQEHRQVARVGPRIVEGLRPTGNVWDFPFAAAMLQMARLSLGQLEAVEAMHDEIEREASRVGHLGALSYCRRSRAHVEWMRSGDLERQTRLDAEDVNRQRALGLNASIASARSAHLRFLSGDWEGALAAMRELQVQEDVPLFAGVPGGMGTLFAGYLEDDSCLTTFREWRRFLPEVGTWNRIGRWYFLDATVEGLAAYGADEIAGELYPITLEAIERCGLLLRWGLSLLERIAGIAASCARKFPEAEAHFERALAQAHEIPFRKEQPEVRHWHARMLLSRDGPGDRAKALPLLREAGDDYEALRMRRHASLVRTLAAGA